MTGGTQAGRGDLRKMAAAPETPVEYALRLGEARVPLNRLLGARLRIVHSGRIHCLACGRQTRKSFNQGYCYPCFRSLARCDRCIVQPERCHYHLGTCREPDWGLANCMQPHLVYLANASGVKVGITRASQVPTRWIDQGATAALPVARVASRRLAGLVEVMFKRHVADRTDWRRMLRGEPPPVDLAQRRGELLDACAPELEALTAQHSREAVDLTRDPRASRFTYPVLEYPQRVRSVNLDASPMIEGTLLGIKGQYLILDAGVLNVRRHGGYEVEVEAQGGNSMFRPS